MGTPIPTITFNLDISATESSGNNTFSISGTDRTTYSLHNESSFNGFVQQLYYHVGDNIDINFNSNDQDISFIIFDPNNIDISFIFDRNNSNYTISFGTYDNYRFGDSSLNAYGVFNSYVLIADTREDLNNYINSKYDVADPRNRLQQFNRDDRRFVGNYDYIKSDATRIGGSASLGVNNDLIIQSVVNDIHIVTGDKQRTSIWGNLEVHGNISIVGNGVFLDKRVEGIAYDEQNLYINSLRINEYLSAFVDASYVSYSYFETSYNSLIIEISNKTIDPVDLNIIPEQKDNSGKFLSTDGSNLYWHDICFGDITIQGIQGPSGEQGIQGIQGEQGIQGLQGIPGSSDICLNDYSDVSFGNVDISGILKLNNVNITDKLTSLDNNKVDISNIITEFVVTANGGNYFIDDIQTPELTLDYNKTYRFKQDASSNGSHPLRFYTSNNNTSDYSYNSGVTIIGQQGSTGSYSEIIINSNTPNTLYYHCSVHQNMGGKLNIINYPLKFSQIDVSINYFINNNIIEGDDVSFGNVDISGSLLISGNVKLTNGNFEVSNNLIFNTISVGDKISFKETNDTTAYNILNDNLKTNNDASFNNVDISGILKGNQGTQIHLGSHIIPTSNAAFDLGNAEYKIRHLYLSDNSLWIGDEHKIDISNGELKFKKRKKNFIPQKIKDLSSNLTTIEDIKSLSNKFNTISDLSSMKLNDWLLVNKEFKKLDSNVPDYNIEDIFNDSSDNWVQQLNQYEKIVELENKYEVLKTKLNTLLAEDDKIPQ